MEFSNVSTNNFIPKKRKLQRSPKGNETDEQRPKCCYNSARPGIAQQYSLQPDSRLLQLPAEIRQSIINFIFRGVKITLANARVLDNTIFPPEETVAEIKALTDHRPNILRVTAVCKQLRVEAWAILRIRKFQACRLIDIVHAEDAAPLLARIEHLSIDITGSWAFYDNYAQLYFPGLRSISTRYVNDYAHTQYARLVNTGFEYDHVMHRINSAFASGTQLIGVGVDFRRFVGNLDVQWATYKKSIDVFARIEFLSYKRTDLVGTIINGLLKIEEVEFGTADMWKTGLGSALQLEDRNLEY